MDHKNVQPLSEISTLHDILFVQSPPPSHKTVHLKETLNYSEVYKQNSIKALCVKVAKLNFWDLCNIYSGLNFEWFHKTLYIFVSYMIEFPYFWLSLFKFFWQILKYFLDFKTKKKFSCTWELFRIRNRNVNKSLSKFLLFDPLPLHEPFY